MYIRPVMEYSAGLAFYWMTKNQQLKNKSGFPDYTEIRMYHDVTVKSIRWIFNKGKLSNCYCLLGLPNSITRLYILALKLRVHLIKMDKDNPLYKSLHPPQGIRPVDAFSLCHKLLKWNDLFNRYDYFGLPPAKEQAVMKKGRNKKVKLNTTSEKLIEQLDGRIKQMIYNKYTKLNMNKCILPTARSKKDTKNNSNLTSPDQCVFLRNIDIRKRAIKWRLNSIGTKGLCPICNKEFRRSHINKCNFIDHYKNWITKKDIEEFQKDVEKNEQLPNTYNILDSLLNHKKYKTFNKIMESLYQYWYYNKE